MTLRLYRASLLPTHTISVETHAESDIQTEWIRPQAVQLHVSFIEESLKTRDFIAASLRSAVIVAQSVFDFSAVTLFSPTGESQFNYFPNRKIVDAATDETISYRATLDSDGALSVHSLEDKDDEDAEYVRLLVLTLPDGRKQVFQGACLMSITAEIRRFYPLKTMRLMP